jgi:hypothetical protein
MGFNSNLISLMDSDSMENLAKKTYGNVRFRELWRVKAARSRNEERQRENTVWRKTIWTKPWALLGMWANWDECARKKSFASWEDIDEVETLGKGFWTFCAIETIRRDPEKARKTTKTVKTTHIGFTTHSNSE